MSKRTLGASVLVLALALGSAACGSTPSSRARTIETPTTTTPAQQVAKVGLRPSAIARMICEPEVHEELEATLGAKTTRPLIATFANGLYECSYVYASGSMQLSVEEFSDLAKTKAAFNRARAKFGVRATWDGLGEGAFTTLGDKVIVRKDNKILVVDVSRLPEQFGVPGQPRRDAALSVASTIMGCWTEA